MPTLNIEGKKVKVGDDFLSLSPEDQARTVDEIASQIGVGTSSTQSFSDAMRKQEPSANIEDTTKPSAIGEWVQGVGDRSGAVLRGVPLAGPYMDEIKAGVRTGFGYAGDYGKELDRVRTHVKEWEEKNPGDALVGQGLGLLGSAVAAAPLAAANLPASLSGRMAVGGLTGGGIGAVEGFGRGEDGLANRVESAKEGAAIGTVLGTAAPLAAAGVGKAVKWGTDKWQRLWDMTKGQSVPDRKAMLSVLRKMEATGLSADDAATRLKELGPQGMLADIGEGMQGATGQVARQDLGAANTIGGRLTARNEAAGQRVAKALDDTFGPAADPYVRQQATKATARVIGQGYDPVYEKAVPYTFELETLSKRIPPSAIKKANELMKVEGVKSKQILVKLAKDGSVKSFQRVPDMRQWDYIQRGLREMAESQDGRGLAGGTNSMGRALTDLRSELLSHIEGSVPEFRTLRSAYRDNAEIQQAYETGLKKVLRDKTMTPARLYTEQAGRSPEAQKALMQGVRTDLDMSLSNARRSPALQADRLLTQNWNDKKMEGILGPQKAGDLARRIGAEETFLDTTRLASPGKGGGSRTAFLLQDQQPKPLGDWTGTIVGSVTHGPVGTGVGLATDIGRKLTHKGLDSLAKRAAEKLARAEAEILTATGSRRGEIIRDLGKLAADIRKAGDAGSAAQIMSFIAATSAANRAPINPKKTFEAGQSYLQR